MPDYLLRLLTYKIKMDAYALKKQEENSFVTISFTRQDVRDILKKRGVDASEQAVDGFIAGVDLAEFKKQCINDGKKRLEMGDVVMNNTMGYKGYVGSVEFSEEDSIFYGKVQGIRALISYEGLNATELVEDFHRAVDDYLILCEANGEKPEKAYKGSFNVRIPSDLHRQAAVYAISHELSLNSFVEQSIRSALKMSTSI